MPQTKYRPPHLKNKTRTAESIRASYLRCKYGITVDEYDAMVEAQGGVCAICSNAPNGDGPANSKLHIDHDHVTGQVRALLCRRCNSLLGLAEDSAERLAIARQYLLDWSAPCHNA